MNYWSIISSIATVAALLVTIFIYCNEQKRERKRATLAAFPLLRKENYELLLKINNLDEDQKELILKKYLSQMEQFAVGVNEGAYDIRIINKMSGGLLVKQYSTYIKAFIENRRNKNCSKLVPSNKLYCEYELMIKKIYKLRKIKWTN